MRRVLRTTTALVMHMISPSCGRKKAWPQEVARHLRGETELWDGLVLLHYFFTAAEPDGVNDQWQ